MIYICFYYSIELVDYNLSQERIITFDIYVFITALSWLTITLVNGRITTYDIYVFITKVMFLASMS